MTEHLPSNNTPGKAYSPNHLPVYLLSVTLDNTLHHIIQQSVIVISASAVG